MYVCLCFQLLTYSWGVVPIPVEMEEKDQGGSYEASIRFTRLGGLKRIRLQIAEISVDRCQDRMLGWVSTFALWDVCSGFQYYYYSGKLHLMIRSIFVLNSRLYQPNTAPRKACQRCCKQSLIITPELNHYLVRGYVFRCHGKR